MAEEELPPADSGRSPQAAVHDPHLSQHGLQPSQPSHSHAPVLVTSPHPEEELISTPAGPRTLRELRAQVAAAEKRDSGVSPTIVGARTSYATFADNNKDLLSVPYEATSAGPRPVTAPGRRNSLLRNRLHKSSTATKTSSIGSTLSPLARPNTTEGGGSYSEELMRITTPIPSAGNLLDLDELNTLSFSKRGSILLGGKRQTTPNGERALRSSNVQMNEMDGQSVPTPRVEMDSRRLAPPTTDAKRDSGIQSKTNGASGSPQRRTGRREPTVSMIAKAHVNGRNVTEDDQLLSFKVRSMYEYGDPEGVNSPSGRMSRVCTADDDSLLDGSSVQVGLQNSPQQVGLGGQDTPRSSLRSQDGRYDASLASKATSQIIREEYEYAGGIEDWQDVDGQDIDRYGFIVPSARRQSISDSGDERPQTPEPKLQRMSTALKIASEAPRTKRTLRRKPSNARSSKTRGPSRQASDRSLHTAMSMKSGPGVRSSLTPSQGLRYATNRLPGNRDRRWMDEAGDMLTLPPGLADVAEDAEGGALAKEMKKKEWERTEKWRKMAKVIGKGPKGTVFDFDTRDPKLIARTWKGIPDCWRATAWHAFLTASAKKRGDFQSDEHLIEQFRELLDENSPDDVQIDLDVPRTINGHIMFRRRYRGG
jgi:hypothetical protein